MLRKLDDFPGVDHKSHSKCGRLFSEKTQLRCEGKHLVPRTFKVGKPDDLWLHARGTPGSHVIVRLEKGQTMPHETLKDAATLTLWFSDLRKSGKGEVIYTLRKFVKKAKGQKPGAVQVTRDKSIWIECKDDRLERLKGITS